MKRRLNVGLLTGLVLILALAATTAVHGAGSDSKKKQDPSAELFNEGMKLAKQGDFEQALEKFEQANSKKKDDPDILNMVAFTQRKTGDLDGALKNYAKALQLRPRFPQAREYLAEAHLDAARAQLEILRGYGPEGRAQLAELVAAIHALAKQAGGEEEEAAAHGW